MDFFIFLRQIVKEVIYPEDIEQRLGFDRVRAMTERRLHTSAARGLLDNARFMTDEREVDEALSLVDEMAGLLRESDSFPMSGYLDTAHLLKRIKAPGSYMDVEQMSDLRTAFETIGDLVRFFRSDDGELSARYPLLCGRAATIIMSCDVPAMVNAILDRFGNVKDSASEALAAVRASLRESQQQVGRRLRALMAQAQSDGIVDEEASISIRDGRAVIPVSAANKRKIKGFVHDESATGRTAYIEPVEVVELNNRIKELEHEERREVIKVLVGFADRLRPFVDELLEADAFLSFIDFVKAKAEVAEEMNGCKPILSTERVIYIKDGRHPILEQTLKKEGKEIVPLTMRLDRDKHILVISGPNAGGKSVCLKSVGLFQYMMQCGWLVSASPLSEMSVFKDIFIDIGDQQSIDNDLSTYSSHLNNMKVMLSKAGRDSLILIDEFGTGTEPAMGGAIAEAILERLESKGVFGVITTHYSNIKFYASKAKGVINGAMSFDVRQIRPLFSLETGKPGSSFAFEIARKTGLPEDIVKEAQAKIGDERVNIEKQLREIARDKRYWESKRDRIRLAEKRAERLVEDYEASASEVLEKRNKLIAEAKAEASRIISEANKLIEKTIREIKEAQAEKERTRSIRAEFDAVRESMLDASSDDEAVRIEAKMQRMKEAQERRRKARLEREAGRSAQEPKAEPAPAPREIVVGDKVVMKGQQMAGEVLSIDGKRATVAFGQITTVVELSRLERVSASEYKRRTKELSSTNTTLFTGGFKSDNGGYDVSQKRLDFKQQIDLRGARVDEAISAVQEYMDEAFMLGIRQVKILHGKGTGALKEEIRRYLKTLPYVASAVDEHVQFGGAGITVVDLNV